ncbi:MULTISPECIES: hypothetical protein [unclassified Haladaptatus]|nr:MULTISPECIES: hypothetical protein [unclassified Haladaptatus]
MLRAISRRLVGFVSDYPLKTTGAVAALVAGAVAYRSLTAVATAGGTSTMGLTPTHLLEFASTHPAYVLALVVGLGFVALAE